MVRLRAGLRQRVPDAHHRHRAGTHLHRQAPAGDGEAGHGADRLYTDIACGVNAGIDTVFVLSGEGTEADIAAYQIHPTWVYPDIGTLYRELEETV